MRSDNSTACEDASNNGIPAGKLSTVQQRIPLVVNAAICANLAAVFSRYQSRVSWLLPLAVIATLLERGMLRWPLPDVRLTTRA